MLRDVTTYRAKGYEFEDFKEAFRRYIPMSEVERFRAEMMEQTAKRDEPGTEGADQQGRKSETQNPTYYDGGTARREPETTTRLASFPSGRSLL